MKNRFPVFSLAVTIFAFLVESKISSSYPNEISFDYFAYPQFPIRGVFLASNQDRFSGKPVRFDLEYDFYRSSCPSAERIVRSKMTEVYSRQSDVTPALLRLFFHDCFVHGCDASILLDDSDGNRSYTAEKRAVPNQTLKGFDKIDIIKEELEKACPGVVSCADTISLATRDGVVLAGGPFYPVLTGRRDSVRSYHNLAMIELPTPDDHLPRILHRFALKGFNERETVSLLGAHNIGQMGCDFIHSRLYNFNGTGKPDPILAPEFLVEMRLKCPRISNSTSSARNGLFKRVNSRGLDESESMNITSVPSGGEFNTHYYQQLVKGRGLLFADQQLMAAQKTERLVRAYASDDGSTFRVDFARVLMKMSNLEVLTGTQGRIRLKCSSPQSSSP